MSLKLLPGIVWALDEPALALVRQWHNGLPHRAQSVFSVAGSWEEFIEIIATYREARFDEAILNAGLSLEPQQKGRRVNVVMISSFPSEGEISWAQSEEKLSRIGDLLSLEHHRVLLYPTLPPVDAPAVQKDVEFSQLSPLRVMPWLLTRVVTGGFTLDEEDFSQHFSRLLDVLLLAEREGGQAPEYLVNSFFQPQPQPGQVRLLGFPRLSLEQLLTEISSSLSHAILHRAYDRPYKDMEFQIVAMEKRLSISVEEFLGGERTAIQVEDQFFSFFDRHKEQLLSVAAILREVPNILERLCKRLQREITISAPPPSWWARLWQKILAFFGWGKPLVRNEPDQMQKVHLVNRFTRITQVMNELAIRAREGQEVPDLPVDFIRSWSDELKDLVLRGIKENWSGEDLTNRMKIRINLDVQQQFFNAIFHWNLQGDRLREVTRALEEGSLLRFSADLIGGLPVMPQAVVTSYNLGQQIRHGVYNVPCATLSFYRGRPPLLLAASEPVPIEHIRF